MFRTLFHSCHTFVGLCLVLALAARATTTAHATPVPLSNPTATVEQGGLTITNTLVNDTNGWATSGAASVGVYQVSPGLSIPDGYFVTLTFTVDSNQSGGCCGDHVLGKFRLAYTNDSLPTAAGANTWVQLAPVSALAVTSNPISLLANNVLEATDLNAGVDIFTVTAKVIPPTYPFTIGGFRLEAIKDATTGNYAGPGIPGNSNFVLDYFAVDSQLTLVPTPEPSTLTLAGLGIVGAVVARRRRRTQA